MQRRGFLLGMLAAGAAPAVVRSGVLMPVRPAIIVPSGLGLLVAEQKRIDDLYIDRMNHAADAMAYGLTAWMQWAHGEFELSGDIGFYKTKLMRDDLSRYNFKRVVL